MLFDEILEESNILLESKYSDDIIKTAIQNCVQISLVYNDKKGGIGKSWRYVCPIVYGQWQHGTKNKGKMVFRGFQLAGSSKRKKKKNAWKVFFADSDHIRGIELLRDEKTGEYLTFSEKELSQIPDFVNKINKSGDKYIYPITYSVPFVNASSTIKSTVTKSDINGETPEDSKNNTPQKDTKSMNQVQTIAGQQIQTKNVEPQSIDKNQNSNIIVNKDKGDTINAPKTQAITKMDIEGPKDAPEINKKPHVNEPEISDTPISKDEVNNGEENKEIENDITPKFKDLMERWARLDKKGEFIL